MFILHAAADARISARGATVGLVVKLLLGRVVQLRAVLVDFVHFVEVLDLLALFFQFHSPILEPNLNLSFGKAERMRDLDPSLPGQIVIELELLLQLQGLVPAVRLPASPPL